MMKFLSNFLLLCVCVLSVVYAQPNPSCGADSLFSSGQLQGYSAGIGAGGNNVSILTAPNTILGAGAQISANNSVADDFIVPSSALWNPSALTFYTYQTGSSTTSTITSINVRLWTTNVPATGLSADYSANSPTITHNAWTNVYRVTPTTLTNTQRPIMAVSIDWPSNFPATLQPGTYWLEWQIAGSLGSGPWTLPTNTGNAKQNIGGTWGNLLDGTNTMGMAFRICKVACTNPTAYNLTGGGTYCAGGAGVAVGLDNSEIDVNYQLQLDGVNDGAAVAGTGAAISFGNKTAAGTYTVVATNAGGACTTNMTGNAVIIVSSPTATITPAGSTTFCAGSPTTLNASIGQGYTYQWKRGATIVQVGGTSYIPTATGSHTVTVTNSLGCKKVSAPTAITINALPTANAGADKSLCKGASVQIGAATTAGYTYTWSPTTGLNDPYISNPTLTTNASGTYTVSVIDGLKGCSKSDAMVLTSISGPATPSVSKTVSGTTITLTSVTPGAASVNWYSNGALLFSNMAANSSINVVASNPAKAYTVKSKGTNGCLSSFSNFVSAKVGDGKTGDVLVAIDENIMQAYPNPTNGFLNVTINDAALTSGTLLLYNNLGQVVATKEISFFAGKANTTLDLQHLAAGVYSLSFENKVIKVVKE